jgi:ATP-binding cassette subfamily B protein
MLYELLVKNFVLTHKLTFFIYILIVFLFYPIEGILLPNIYGKLHNSIAGITPGEDITSVISNITKMNFAGIIAILLIIWVIITLAYAGKGYVETILFPEYIAYLRTTVYERLINNHTDKYTDIKTGEYLTRIMEFTKTCSSVFQHILTRFFPEVIVVVIIIIYMFTQNQYIGLMLLISFLMCGMIQYMGGTYLIETNSKKETHFNSIIGENLQNSLDNLMNVYINNESSLEISKNVKNEREHIQYTQHIANVQQLIILITEIIIVIAYGICLWILFNMFKQKEISTSKGVVLILILGQYLHYSMSVNSGFLYHIISKFGILHSSYSFLNEILKPNPPLKLKDTITNCDILFNNISFKYEKDSSEFLFENLNLYIKGGTKVGLVGRSGSGKTTLMKMLIRLYNPTEGEIFIDGVDISKMNVEYLRDNVNYINQRTSLLNETVLYNIKYGNEHISEDEIVKIMKDSGLDEIFEDLPDGLYGDAGVNGGNLSGGMQKVIIVVRGLLKKGKCKVLDEPLAGLDKKTIKKMLSLISKEKVTLIVISHDASILPSMDKVIDIQSL